jgi:integrase
MRTDLPRYVSRDDRGYVFRPYLRKRNGKPVYDKRQVIAPPGATIEEVWKAWERVSTDMFTLGWLLSEYHNSKKFQRLSPKTQSDYQSYRERLLGYEIEGGVFARAQLEHITKRTIRHFLDVYPAPVAANRHIAYLKAAWSWVEERHEIPPNPCLKVTMNEETPRDRYVTPEEYQVAYDLACPELKQMMELAYLCRARWSEVMNLTVEDVSDDHVRLIRLKGSEGELTTLSERLRAAVSDVRGYPYLCHRYSRSGFSSAWRRLMARVEKQGVERFTFHDLKAAGISDHKSNHSGHRSPNMRKVYVRKLQLVEPTAAGSLKVVENG